MPVNTTSDNENSSEPVNQSSEIMQPPLMVDVTSRKRLFDLIDQAARRPCVWITASAGYGKSTALASYIEQSDQPSIWYSLNAADSDPVQFFQRLSSGILAQLPHLDLPEISLINLADPVAFGLSFFTAFKEESLTIVLDDYQHLAADSLVHPALSASLELLKPGSFLIGSREPPPPAFTRQLANSVIECLVAENLKFTAEETRDLFSQRSSETVSTDQIEQLQNLSEGWVAGLVLLLNQQKFGSLPKASDGLVFDYFMQEILSKYDQETRQFLITVALLPEITPEMASHLTGVDEAETILNSVSRSLSFIQRSDQNPPVYRFHALFRNVLLDIGKTEMEQGDLDQLKHKAVEILVKNDHLDAAINLLIELQDWQSLVGLILSNAEPMLTQGKAITLKHWLHQIPEPIAAQITWVSFWEAMCDLAFMPRKTRNHLENILERFKQEGDATGIYLTWSFIVESYWMERNEVYPLAEWVEVLEDLMKNYPMPDDPMIQARVTYGRYIAISLYGVGDIDVVEEQMMALLRSPMPAEQKVIQASSMILNITWQSGRVERSSEIRALIHPLFDQGTLSPMARFLWCLSEFFHHYWFNEEPLSGAAYVNEMRRVGEKHALKALWPLYQAVAIYIPIIEGRKREAENALADMSIDLAERTDVSYWEGGHHAALAASVYLIKEQFDIATKYGESTLEFSKKAHPVTIAFSSLVLSDCYLGQGKRQKALASVRLARKIARQVKSYNSEFSACLFLAQYTFRLGRQQRGENLLRHAFKLGKERGFVRNFYQDPKEMAVLCVHALNAGIDPDYTKRLIKAHLFTSPPEDMFCEKWPWPVRIHALGSLQIEVDGKPLVFEGKAQARPLAMLRELIANCGEPLRTDQIAVSLWPDSNEEKNKANIKTTLQRLRKLLGQESILLNEGRLSFNLDRCWSDVCEFKTRLEFILENNDSVTTDQIEKVLSLYRGSLLEGSETAENNVPQRQSLEKLYIDGLQLLVKRLLDQTQDEKAISWLQKGFEIDPVAETLYQELIRIYLGLNKKSEALRVYHLCESQLENYLKVKPSEKTRQLISKLR